MYHDYRPIFNSTGSSTESHIARAINKLRIHNSVVQYTNLPQIDFHQVLFEYFHVKHRASAMEHVVATGIWHFCIIVVGCTPHPI